MIAVIGATGNVGSSIVQKLAAAGEQVTAISRRGGTDTQTVRHVRADLAHPAELRESVRDARAVFVMIAGSGEGLETSAIVDAVTSGGKRHVVLLSSIGTRSRPTAASHEPLRMLESAIAERASSWTILQPTGFASNAMFWISVIRGQRTVMSPFGNVGIPLVDPEDIGAVAAAALRDDRHVGQTYVLTGPARITPREQTEAIAAAIGAPLTFVELTRAQATEGMRQFMPAPIVETTLDAIGTPNELERHVSGDVASVLGRPAGSFAAWASRNAHLFR